jgi:hypothetical protein
MSSILEAESYKNAVGGKLSLKGCELKRKKHKKKSHGKKRQIDEAAAAPRERVPLLAEEEVNPEDYLTPAQKKYNQIMQVYLNRVNAMWSASIAICLNRINVIDIAKHHPVFAPCF